jgi:antitoxin component YwqK of YwqJK toxin-antitoxin module
MAAVTMERREQLPVKWLMLIVLFAACFSNGHPGAESKWYNEASIHLQNVKGIYKQNDSPFTGIVYSLAETKDTIAVGSFLNGMENGEWRKYYSNRQLMERRYYSNGKKTGVYEGWWANGKKRLLYHFKNGEYEGNCIDWSDKGSLVSSMNYVNGYESGLQQQFYENGKVKANYMMLDGRRYGLLGTKNCVNVSDSVFKK